MYIHFSCSSEGPVEVETDQAKLTETNKQRTAGKSSEQVIESILFLVFISYLGKVFVVYLKLSVCYTWKSMEVVYVNCCLFSTIYSC